MGNFNIENFIAVVGSKNIYLTGLNISARFFFVNEIDTWPKTFKENMILLSE